MTHSPPDAAPAADSASKPRKLAALFDWSRRRFPRLAAIRRWYTRRRAVLLTLAHIVGAISSIQAIMSTRTPQGAIAWAISLNTAPYVAVPAYWVFGRSKFDGYDLLRQRELLEKSETQKDIIKVLRDEGMLVEGSTPRERNMQRLAESLAMMPITRFNDADLLIDGEATFDAIFESIARAENYVLVQFYIMRSDELGNRLKDALIARARDGVRAYVMYDGLGGRSLGDEYVKELADAGVEVAAFRTTEEWGDKTRLNFRNHRKIVVVDGKEAFVGGFNVGDEYMGKHPTLTPWRDTHVAVRGPAALEAQVSFVEDWSWASGEIPDLNWRPERAPEGNMLAICLPTGPADRVETATLMTLSLINSAEKRIWIASPYFVPDATLMSALQLAALRGVDVRVLMPQQNDDWLVDLTSYSYLEEAERTGIKMFRYQPGLMHQKVMLIDDNTSAIGTANFDNRSMRLNFEVTMILHDESFAGEVERMLEADLARCEPAPATDYTDRSAPYRFFVRTARLLAPVQ
jgi:cardiolipin synthase